MKVRKRGGKKERVEGEERESSRGEEDLTNFTFLLLLQSSG